MAEAPERGCGRCAGPRPKGLSLRNAKRPAEPPDRRSALHFVIHAVDRPDALPDAREVLPRPSHPSRSGGDHGVAVMTAGTLVAADGETPVGSLFILEAENRAAVDAFTASDPYQVNGVWQTVDVHYYNKKR